MDDRFYNLPEEKQRRIINAAFMVFAENCYKKAPMSEIAEAGNISKALLFHYFHNKRDLYLYLWDIARSLVADSMVSFKVYDTNNLWEILRRSLKAKCFLMRKYEYLMYFTLNCYYENEKDISSENQKLFSDAEEVAIEKLEQHIDKSLFRGDMEFAEIFKHISYTSDGMLIQMYRRGTIDVDVFKKEYLSMIRHWERIYSAG